MERIATRKLQRLGGSAYVSLPAPWLKLHRLDGGDPVDIYLDRGRIVITASRGATGE